MAKLIFFLIGINIKDLHTLKDIENGYVHYRQAKTGGLYSIKIEPEIQVLFDKYKGTESLLCFEEQYKLHTSLMKKINKGLAAIAPKIGSIEITTYSLRHSWATIAAELEIPKETIAAALGHSWGNSVTDIYIDFNRKKIDEANRKVIDYIFS